MGGAGWVVAGATGGGKGEGVNIKSRVALMPCLACCAMGVPDTPAELHHPLTPGKRRIHADAVVPLCPTHHRAGKSDGEYVGRHNGARAFAARYGTDAEMWERVRAVLVAEGRTESFLHADATACATEQTDPA